MPLVAGGVALGIVGGDITPVKVAGEPICDGGERIEVIATGAGEGTGLRAVGMGTGAGVRLRVLVLA